MAALQCELCGGKLVGKPGGVFECDSCGMEYSTEWAKAKIQEIKGTVKVEGTVEVQGTVKVEGSANKEALLTRGQLALKDGQFDSAQSFFDQVLNADAQCGEAYFGIVLAKAKCPDTEAFVQRGIRSARENPCTAEVRDQKAEEDLIRSCETPPFLTAESLKRQLNFDFTYRSRLPSLEANRKKAEQFLETSKELTYAQEYGSAQMKQRIQDWMASLQDAYEAAIGEAKQQNQTSVREVEERYRQWLSRKEAGFSRQKSQLQVWDDVYSNRELLDFLHQLLCATQYGGISLDREGTGFSRKKTEKWDQIPEWTGLVSLIQGHPLYYSYRYFVGLKSDGTVVTTLDKNAEDISSWRDIVAVETGDGVVAGLKSDGTVVTNKEKNLTDFENVVAITVDGYGSVTGLRADGTIASYDSRTITWCNIVAIAQCDSDILGLKADGTVLTTCSDPLKKEISRWTDIAAVAASQDCAVGLKSDGTLVAAAAEKGLKLDVSSWKNIVAVDVVGLTVWGLTADGMILSTDPNAEKRPLFRSLSDLNPLVADRFAWKRKLREKIAARNDKWRSIYSDRELLDLMQRMMRTHPIRYLRWGEHCWENIFLKADGSVHSQEHPALRAWSDIVDLATLGDSAAGLKQDGTVVGYGQPFEEPLKRANWQNIVEIQSGSFLAGLKADGTIVSMSDDQNKFSRWSYIVTFTLRTGLKADGTLIVTGENCRDARYWKNIVAFSESSRHIVGLRSDGTVVAAGDNSLGQCDVSSWRDIVSVAACDNYTVGLKADGTVVGTEHAELPETSPDCFVLAVGEDSKFWMSNGLCIQYRWLKTDDPRKMPFDSPDSLIPLAEKRRREKGALVEKFKAVKRAKLTEVKNRMAQLPSEIAALQEELANLKGLFAGMRRGSLESRLSERKTEYSDLERLCKKLEAEL